MREDSGGANAALEAPKTCRNLKHLALVGGYSNWCAVAAFFDGDGTVHVDIKKDVLSLRLLFVDNWLPQVGQICRFLQSQGIITTRIWKTATGAYEFAICQRQSVVSSAKNMLCTQGCLFKKRDEIRWLLDYYGDKITGEEFIGFLNHDVKRGNRVGKIRSVSMPFSYSIGLKQRYIRIAQARRILTVEQKEQILIDKARENMTLAELAARYAVSISTIARTIGTRRNPKWLNSR